MRITNRAKRYEGSTRHQFYAVVVGCACVVEGLETDIRWNLISSESQEWIDGNISLGKYLKSIVS